MAFWSYVEPGGELDPEAAGRALREIHEALADYTGDLPELHTQDLSDMLDSLEPSDDVDLLRTSALESRPVRGRRSTATHISGTACLGRCGTTSRRMPGPREFDLAPLDSGTTRGPGSPSPLWRPRQGVLEQCIPAYAAWIYAS